MVSSYLGMLPSTSKGTLDHCPLVTPLNTNDSILASSENDILRRFTFNVSDPTGQVVGPIPYNLYQHIGPNGAVSAVLQIVPPSNGNTLIQPGNAITVEVTLNNSFTPSNAIPLVYSFLCNVPGATLNTVGPNDIEIAFAYPNDPSTAVITIAQLGYINSAEFSIVNQGAGASLQYAFNSDKFISNPVAGTIDAFTGVTPQNFLLPSNETTVLQRIRHHLKKAAKIICVPESQIKNMAVAAFIHELGCLFRCNDICRPRPLCDQKIYIEYITFVTSCIKCIAYCEEVKPATIEICKPACTVNVGGSCEIVNREIVECARRWSCPQVEAKVCTEVSVMFGDIAPCGEYEAVCVGDEYFEESESDSSSVICPAEVFEKSSSSESEEEMKREKKRVVKRAPRKAVVKTKTTTSVSTYGWYAAAGVATITVAVVVYIFVL